MAFDIHAFDSTLLDIATLLEALAAYPATTSDSWTLTQVSANEHRIIYRADPYDPVQLPVLAIKCYHRHDYSRATLEQKVLQALYDLGLGIAPRPFYASESPLGVASPVLVCEWLSGEALRHPPLPADEQTWQHMMAALGSSIYLPFAEYAHSIPMRGSGPQSPGDLLQTIDSALAKLDPNLPQYEALAALVTRAHDRTAPTWNAPPKITLNHLDPRPHHFIANGQYVRLLGWDNADWLDTAYAVAQLCAHPAYEEVSPSHWVWYRWQFARLTHDEMLIPRATLYTNLLQVFWGITLISDAQNAPTEALRQQLKAQQSRYFNRAERAFPNS
jgi:hypothetical protein